MAAPAGSIDIGKFLEELRAQLVAVQQRHSGEAAVFQIEEIEAEVAFTVSTEAGGGVKFWVVSADAKVAGEATHRVKLRCTMAPEGAVVFPGTRYGLNDEDDFRAGLTADVVQNLTRRNPYADTEERG